jgi:hypothetical protein
VREVGFGMGMGMTRYAQRQIKEWEQIEETVVVPKGKQLGRVIEIERLLAMTFTAAEALRREIIEEREARLSNAKYPYRR